MSKYSDFAFYYDGLTKNVEYHKRALYFDILIKKYKKSGGNYLVDLACGTGSLSEEFCELGYDVTGIDNSEDMLGEAMDKKYDSGSDIQYVCQDMREFELYGNADIIICALDSINHLSCAKDIQKTIERAYLFLECGGVFIFDANTVYKHREVLGNNAFTFENDQVFCAWQNFYNNDDKSVEICLDFFEKTENNYYKRFTQTISEIALETEQMDDLLINAGFEIAAHFDDDSMDPVHEKSQRVIYVARKKS
ncbi:MAG: class I SAM-dependent methyltransferase [Oscillospiraceae bacterium]|nr:class I SAM-dependent methyltransferase [Oscillospiraceae bacterium]